MIKCWSLRERERAHAGARHKRNHVCVCVHVSVCACTWWVCLPGLGLHLQGPQLAVLRWSTPLTCRDIVLYSPWRILSKGQFVCKLYVCLHLFSPGPYWPFDKILQGEYDTTSLHMDGVLHLKTTHWGPGGVGLLIEVRISLTHTHTHTFNKLCTCTYMYTGLDKERECWTHTIAFWKFDITSCDYSQLWLL